MQAQNLAINQSSVILAGLAVLQKHLPTRTSPLTSSLNRLWRRLLAVRATSWSAAMLFDRERAFFPLSLLHSDVLYALMAARPVSVPACAFLPCGQTQACLLDGRMAGQMASSHLALAYQ